VLARETGKYLIQHVYEGVVGTPGVSRVVIATDSPEVEAAARSFGAEARMTSPQHLSGTDRVAEVARGFGEEIGVVVNVQGDEPLSQRQDVARLVRALGPDVAEPMATLARRRLDREGFLDPNIVKVVVDGEGRALYFSRASIPHGQRPEGEWLQHIGMYAFRREFLQAFTALPAGELERREKLEQLRALEHGVEIRVLLTENEYAGIDTEEEYRRFVEGYRTGR
jgi:3-deoxy-manno-octulosonate cytidylyltransferase (CMP-KDO synthetase)